MLDEYKQIYYESANLLDKNWEKLSRSELCNKYLEAKEAGSSLTESYLSAIIYKFWNVTNHNYHTQQFKSATEEDAYEWSIKGILYALDHHVWTDPENVLYGDEEGPEKAINICIYTKKLNFFQAVRTAKRKVNYGILSLEKLEEDVNDGYYLPYEDKDESLNEYLKVIIKDAFIKKDYCKAFVLDALANCNLFETQETENGLISEFSGRKLKYHLRNLDDRYCAMFSDIYGINFELVKRAIPYVVNLTWDRLNRNINNLFKELRKDKELLSVLRSN